jgi:lysophospholipid acyltransferase (LPLAT)-like uncharacterized protein
MMHRLKLLLVTEICAWAIRLIGCTLRWEAEGAENFDACEREHGGGVAAFWHGCLFASVWFWRRRGIVVMTSRHRDGEYISRIIHRFGFLTARGSSSRGARRALSEMMEGVRKSAVVAITVDGPRGPRRVAKPGAVWLAARTGRPLIPYHISAEKKWRLRSWDRFEIPKPFSRAYMRMLPPHHLPANPGDEQLEQERRWLQAALDDLAESGERRWRAPALGPRKSPAGE